jgi:hypothetical protein
MHRIFTGLFLGIRLETIKEEFVMLINSIRRLLTKAQTKYFVPLIGGLFIFVLLTVSCQTDLAQPTPPPDSQLVAEVDLSAQSYDAETVGEFTVVETAVTHIFYTIPNIDTTNFDLSLIGPNDESFVILHSEDFRTDEKGGGTWEQNLAPGTYQIMLTASQTPGTLSVYWTSK